MTPSSSRTRRRSGSCGTRAVAAWFPQGPDDDGVVLIKVQADSAEYWNTPGGRLSTAFSFVKAKVTGERIDGGENEKVDL